MDIFENSILFDKHDIKDSVGELDDLPKDFNGDIDVELIQQHYIQMLANDFVRGKRAKKDRELRMKSRKLFEILSSLLHRIQLDHSISVDDDDTDDERPSDSNRCRDSDLRTLRKANQTLLALIDVSRDLKKKKRELKARKKRIQMKSKKTKVLSDQAIVVKDLNQHTQYPLQVNQFMPNPLQTNCQPYPGSNGVIYQQPFGCSQYNLKQVPTYQMNYTTLIHESMNCAQPYAYL
mmetsp:Transcript_9961/g.9647  ORF Transcript_9961/g.9647 Transcript_9961/m.9647 type:complete len:235 (-) Transcript_9961:84-788(-)